MIMITDDCSDGNNLGLKQNFTIQQILSKNMLKNMLKNGLQCLEIQGHFNNSINLLLRLKRILNFVNI